MKQLILIMSLALSINAYAQQDDQTVTLTVSGQGETMEEAKQNALRSAIEQAFGTFISSKTEILNDNLVKDEIVSVANGNIQKFEIISEVQIPNGGYATSLKATVSVTKLTSFVESKGFEVEFKGSLFGANLRQQRMNENAELKAIINLCEVSNQILSNSIDYSIEVDEPIKANNSSSFKAQQDDYQILLTIKLSPNKNFDQFVNYFYSSIKAISMPVPEQENYIKLNKEIYYLTVNNDEKYFFRNPKTAIALQNLFLKSNQYLHNFKVVSNLDTITVNTCCFDYKTLNSFTAHTDQVTPIVQNMYAGFGNPEIWHLNSGDRAYSSMGSKNGISGYPQFYFQNESLYYNETYDWMRNYSKSSWSIYFEYLLYLRNNKILFESNNYFTQTGSFYEENGIGSRVHNRPRSFYYPSSRVVKSFLKGGQINLTKSKIGQLNLTKIDYYCKYLAIYSEEEISKITKISVGQLK